MTKAAAVYGQSLYDLAKEENLTDKIFEEFKAVTGIISDEPDYVRLLSEPSLSRETRIKLIDEAFAGKIEGYLLNFVKILCEKNAVGELKGCFEAFKDRYYDDNGIAEASVITASALTDEQKASLKDKLEKMSGRQIVLLEKADPRLIAGMRVELMGRQYDGTALGRFNAIRKRVTDIIV